MPGTSGVGDASYDYYIEAWEHDARGRIAGNSLDQARGP
jgi:hypothetical protein